MIITSFAVRLMMCLPVLGMLSCTPSDKSEAQGQSIFVDPVSGNDNNSGRSPAEALRSLEILSGMKFSPGEAIRLRGGVVHTGSLVLDSITGTSLHPVVISSYGNGKAIIRSGAKSGLRISNSMYLEVRNIAVSGSGRLTGSESSGVELSRVNFVQLDSIEASGYLWSGVEVSAGRNIRITRVHASGNGFAGIYAGPLKNMPRGESDYLIRNLYIGYSVAENNPGCYAVTDNHSGSGIIAGHVRNAVIEYCETMNNGWDMPRGGNGPVGIWSYQSDSVYIQHCFSHHNKTSPTGHDGGGFDFDGGMTRSVLQYNLSAWNEGAGYGLFQYNGAAEWKDNIMRFNISYNDGSKNSKAGIFIWMAGNSKPMTNAHVYHNTIINSYGHGIAFTKGTYAGFRFENNIFMLTGKNTRFLRAEVAGPVFENNLYWSEAPAKKGNQTSRDLYDLKPVIVDPGLILPDAYSPSLFTKGQMQTMRFFKLRDDSQARGKATAIGGAVARDFWGDQPGSSGSHLGADAF